jgi:hypothetical protein
MAKKAVEYEDNESKVHIEALSQCRMLNIFYIWLKLTFYIKWGKRIKNTKTMR